MIFIMKHKLPIAIFIVAIAATTTGIISFQSGFFQTASIGELVRTIKPSDMSDIVVDFTPGDVTPDMPTAAPGPECNEATKPWIKVVSPNGNETYTAGHKVTVKWVSCNIDPTEKIHVGLSWEKSKDNISGRTMQEATVNDTQETLALPSNVGNGESFLKGKLYKVEVVQSKDGKPNYDGAMDTSDGMFTILNRVQ